MKKPMNCEQESGVVRALHTGEWSAAARLHVAECADCSQTLALAQALQVEALRTGADFHPPDAHWIVERARRRSREISLRRVGLLLAAMRALAAVYVVAAAGWLLRGYATVQFREVASSMSGNSAGFALLGAGVAAVCVLAGLWPILRDRPGQG